MAVGASRRMKRSCYSCWLHLSARVKLCQHPCSVVASLSARLESVVRVVVENPRIWDLCVAFHCCGVALQLLATQSARTPSWRLLLAQLYSTHPLVRSYSQRSCLDSHHKLQTAGALVLPRRASAVDMSVAN